MTNTCKCGHDEENHYLGTDGCANCYKVDKYLCTKFEPMKEEEKTIKILKNQIADNAEMMNNGLPFMETKTESWEERWKDFWKTYQREDKIKAFISSEISKAEQRGYNKGFDKGFVEGLTKLDRKGDEPK